MRAVRLGSRAALAFSVAVAAALAGCAGAAASSGPDLVNARLQGAWNLDLTVASYTGPVNPNNRPVGHKATDRIWFESTCPAPGSCSVRIWGPTGPDPSQTAYYTYYGNASGFEGTVGQQLLQQTGAAYAVSIPIGGFGGLVCSPPSGATRPAQTLTLQVVDAVPNGAGWLATTVTGTEELVAGWGCSGGKATGWIAQKLSILGHPVGYVAPASAAAAPTGLRVSSLAAALNSPQQAFRTPGLLVVNLVITALVILFVTFPSALFNHTLSEHYAEVTGAFKRLEAAAGVARRSQSRLATMLAERRREAAIFAGVLLVGGVVNGLLDPRFGFNGTSGISYLATLSTLLFGIATTGIVAFLYRRARGRETTWHFQALPFGLLIAAACVFLSRLSDFQPGYFYGLVCGIAFSGHLAKQEDGHTAAIASVVTMVAAVLAWFGWTAVNPSASQSGASSALILLDDFLASVFVGGLVGHVVGLLPLQSLQGGKLIAWRRAVWAVVFGVAVFGLVQVLLHPEQGAVHPSQAPLVTAILLFVGFGGASLAFNRYFTWQGRPTRTFADAPEPAASTAARP